MKLWQISLLLINCLGLAIGQLLFKRAAMALRGNAFDMKLAWAAMANVSLIAALVLYAALTLLWVYILSVTELSKAYPFTALTLTVTPLLASWMFDERLSPSYFVGMALIVAGVLIIAWGGRTA